MSTIVLIPGLLCTSALFAAQQAELAKTHKVLVADTTGLDSLTAMARRLLEETDGPLILFGLSMGGYIAMETARLDPDRVRGLGLFSSGARADTEDKKKMRRELVRLSSIGRFKGVTPRLLPTFLSPQAAEDEQLTQTVMQMAEQVGQHNFALQQKAIADRRDQRPHLPGYSGPCVVVCGDIDELTPPELSHEMAELLPDSELRLLPDVGHLSTMEAPQACLAAMQSLLERAEQGGQR